MDMSPSSTNSAPMPMSMSSMMMAFFTSNSTTLYSMAWTPSSKGQYAGTCVFLILLGTIFRALFALRAIQEAKKLEAERKRRYVIGSGMKKKSDDDSKEPIMTESGVLEVPAREVRPWRLSTDVPRAIMDTIIAGVGYLLSVFLFILPVASSAKQTAEWWRL
jgi:copper transporter 1